MPPNEESRQQAPRCILVVDDEPLIGKAVSSVLRTEGFEVEWLDDGCRTVEKIQAMPSLVLVLLDVVMPGVNGFDVLRQIRAHEQYKNLPVVMLTGHDDPEYVAEGLRAGADGFILKPFKPARLIRYVQETLSAR